MSADRNEPTDEITPRVFAAFLAARAAFGLVYLGVTLAHWPVPWYYPLEHRWELTSTPRGLAMGWFGTTAISLASALIVGAALWLISARPAITRVLARGVVVLAIARAGGLVLLVDYVYFGWALTHQTPKPLAVPCPK